MVGHLALNRDLEAMIRAGDVDTVLTVFPDVMGASWASASWDATSSTTCRVRVYMPASISSPSTWTWSRCRASSSPRGQAQDMKMVPDLGTLRLIPWLPKTALVFCDVYTEEGEPIEEAPRWILQRQVERAAKRQVYGQDRRSSSSTSSRSRSRRRAQALPGLTPVSRVPGGLPHPPDDPKEEPLIRAHPQRDGRRRVPVEISKGEWGRGQEEINLRYAEALEMADRHTLYKHGAKEIAHLQGCSAHLHGEVRRGRGGLVVPPALLALGQTGARPLFDGKSRAPARRSSGTGWPASWRWPASSRTSTRRPSTPTSATRRVVRADPDRGRLGQPDVRLPALRGGLRLPRREPDSGRRCQPLPGLRRDHRGRTARHPAS